jgi:hypothetical protein
MSSPRSLVLTLVSFVVACTDRELEPCPVETETVLALGDGEGWGTMCTITPTGLVLYVDGFQLVLERLSEQGELQELTSVETQSQRCGTVAEDPESGTIWLTAPGSEFFSGDVAPAHRLLTLDAEGQTLSEELLVVDGEPVYIRSSFARAGELYLAGSVHVPDPMSWPDFRALIERRDANGLLVWRQLAYAGFNPNGGFDDVRDFHELGPIIPLDEGIAAFATLYGTDASSRWIMTLRDSSGDPLWVGSVSGGDPQLGSDGGNTVWVSESHQRIFDFDFEANQQLGLLRPARSVVTRHAGGGWTWWRGEVEWAELDELHATNAVGEGSSVFHVVSGFDVDDAARRHVSLARQDWTGAVDCTASLDDLGLWSATSLHQLESGRLVLGGHVARPNESDPDEPLLQPAIVLLDVESEPAIF